MRRLQLLDALGIRSLRQWFMIISAVLLFFGFGWYWYNQQGKVNWLKSQSEALQKQVTVLPDGRDRISLQKDLIALDRDRIALENSIAASTVQTIGGFLLFVTAYVSWQNLRATERNVLISQEKQVTERFTQAINQLGSDKIEVRFGGIYALERIAKDSPKDHWTIMEILTSCIKDVPISLESKRTVPTYLQAALTVIGRRNVANDPQDKQIDLRRTCLVNADLRGLNLHRANLRDADLGGADLEGATFQEANLNGCDLDSASLKEANFHRASLRSANLIEADLRWAILTGADLSGADLSGASLWQTDLTGADLSGADLSGVSLWQANLRGANLSGTEFKGANLNGTNLRNTRELTLEQIKVANQWEQAHYDKDFRQQLGLPPETEKES